LKADDRRSRKSRDGIRPHPPPIVDRDSNDALAAKAEQRQGLQDARVHLVADDDRDGRRAEKAPRFHIPALAGEQGMSGRGQTRHVGGSGAGDETAAGSRGSAKRSTSHPRATSSRAAAIGDSTRRPAFWSQTVASQFAARAAGSDPPMTKPK
jgi:hypothetical protein